MNEMIAPDIEALYHYFLHSSSLCTDSRQVKAGDFFVALKGANFDGNQFALQALKAGASWAVVSDKSVAASSPQCLYVPDTLVALQELARMHRRKFDIPVIAITGTNGKTTTKELMCAVLRQRYQVLATEGNLNNHIGVPLTLLRLTARDEVAIIEMGASAAGEIALLASIAEPTHGLITNIGKAHLEGFGSQEGILHAKSELVEYLLQHHGTFLLNADDPLLLKLWGSHPFPRYALGQKGLPRQVAHAEVRAAHPYLALSIEGEAGEVAEVHSHLVGAYNASNLLAATALGQMLQVPLREIKEALEAYTPSNHRSQCLQMARGVMLILDCYNANPSSMQAALENLCEVETPHKLAILGDMKELGTESRREHQQVVAWLQEHPTVEAFLCGEEFGKALATIQVEARVGEEPCLRHFATIAELEAYLEQAEPLAAETTILLKGSRSLQLEKAVPQIQALAEKGMPEGH